MQESPKPARSEKHEKGEKNGTTQQLIEERRQTSKRCGQGHRKAEIFFGSLRIGRRSSFEKPEGNPGGEDWGVPEIVEFCGRMPGR